MSGVCGLDVLLTASGDLDLSSGDLQLTRSVAQSIDIALKTAQGEWFLDTTLGVPYYDQIFVKNPDINLITSAFRSVILGVAGVEAINSLNVTLNSTTRTLSVSFSISTGDDTVLGITQVGY